MRFGGGAFSVGADEAVATAEASGCAALFRLRCRLVGCSRGLGFAALTGLAVAGFFTGGSLPSARARLASSRADGADSASKNSFFLASRFLTARTTWQLPLCQAGSVQPQTRVHGGGAVASASGGSCSDVSAAAAASLCIACVRPFSAIACVRVGGGSTPAQREQERGVLRFCGYRGGALPPRDYQSTTQPGLLDLTRSSPSSYSCRAHGRCGATHTLQYSTYMSA